MHLLQKQQGLGPLATLRAGTDGCVVGDAIRLHPASSHLLQQLQRLLPARLFLASAHRGTAHHEVWCYCILAHAAQQLEGFSPPPTGLAAAHQCVVSEQISRHACALHPLQQQQPLRPLVALCASADGTAVRDGVWCNSLLLHVPQQLQAHCPLPGLLTRRDCSAVSDHVGIRPRPLHVVQHAECLLPPKLFAVHRNGDRATLKRGGLHKPVGRGATPRAPDLLRVGRSQLGGRRWPRSVRARLCQHNPLRQQRCCALPGPRLAKVRHRHSGPGAACDGTCGSRQMPFRGRGAGWAGSSLHGGQAVGTGQLRFNRCCCRRGAL
mmetsp:Transcript_72578/g.200189  ORF Transcript_72578/g.200189 Transcript_72578/m.200189 type:complete len:323 (+) Transcript_72578:1336-2304(+)